MRKWLASVVSDEEGATMVEYVLLVGLIAIAAMGALTAFSGSLQSAFGKAGSAVTGQ